MKSVTEASTARAASQTLHGIAANLKASKTTLCFDVAMVFADHPSLTPIELAAAGQALFGVHWRGEMARRLAVTEAQIRLIEKGAMPVPPEWRARLIGLAQDVSLRALQIASELMWDEAGVDVAAVERSA